MMICDADFEELFPDLFQPEPAPGMQPIAKGPSAECIARWEDDGGLPGAPRERTAPVRSPVFAYDMDGFSRAGAIAAVAPANAAYAAIRTMFSAYDEMTTRRDIRF